MVQKLSQEFRRFRTRCARTIRSTDAGIRKSSQNRINTEVIQFEVFLGSSLPIADVRLVPHFPEPRLDFALAIPLAQMANELIDQLRPLWIAFRRIRPSGINRPLWKVVTIWRGMNRKRLRHEANFHERPNSCLVKTIEDAIQDGPTINGLSRSIFCIDICRSPLQRRASVTSSEKIMNTNQNRLGTESRYFSEQLLAVGRVSIVGLIVSEVVPDLLQGSFNLVRIHLNAHWVGSLLANSNRSVQEQQNQTHD